MTRHLLILVVSLSVLALAPGSALGQAAKSGAPKRFGVECRGDFVIVGVYAIRRDSVQQVHLVRDQETGELKYGLLTFARPEGVEQLMIGVNDFEAIVDCLGR